MFKNLLASIGIGAAKVDTRLDGNSYQPGDTFHAEIHIAGGDVAQTIDGLSLDLMTQVEVEHEDGESIANMALQTWRLSERFVLAPRETRVIPFEGFIGYETPITALPCPRNNARVWVRTGLSIDNAVDASDRDHLAIQPLPAMLTVIQALEARGFRLLRSDVEKGFLRGDGFVSQSGCYQELEFEPQRGKGFGSGINEIEVSFVPTETALHTLFEVDRKFRGDSYISMSIDPGTRDVGTLSHTLARLLRLG